MKKKIKKKDAVNLKVVIFDKKDLVSSIRKQYGDSVITSLDEDRTFLSYIPYGISTQSLQLDMAIGRPGLPVGRMIEIMGLNQAAKSTLGYQILAETKRIGGIPILVEFENKIDRDRMQNFGFGKELIIVQPSSLEEAFELNEKIICEIRDQHSYQEVPIAIVWDSLAGAMSAAQVIADYDTNFMALEARIISKSYRKFQRLVADRKVLFVALNQVKHDLLVANPMLRKSGGDLKSTGGEAPKYLSSLRILLQRKENYEKGEKNIEGIWVNAVVQKNDVAKPLKSAKILILFDTGLDKYDDLYGAAAQLSVIITQERSFIWGGEKYAKKKWIEIVDSQGGADVYRKILTQEALEKGVIKSYGIVEDRDLKRREIYEETEKHT